MRLLPPLSPSLPAPPSQHRTDADPLRPPLRTPRPPSRQDVALVRLYRELYRRLQDSAAAHVSDVKCETAPWGGAWEVEKWLKEEL